ncbi:low temperature requirement protein A [Streptomyces sp. NPDC052236]|uniref:low temperature requirement protein A n=1 Tax=Streptomyces sp. NPDC052236 TaxID=3365686 RepID=UPI0037D4C7D8
MSERARPFRLWVRPITARDPAEPHRGATPLELLFDLCFVVAVAQVAAQLHHAVSEDHASTAILSYFAVFFAIWWAWMGFTWFASAYDIDDVPYRLATFVQIAGILVLASGVPRAFEHHDFTMPVVGYTIMRLALISQWLRAARAHPESRATTVRYAVRIAVIQCAWIGWLFLPADMRMPVFALLALCDTAVPVWAETAGGTAWHPHHIAERFGLFTLIVLGESVLAATTAVQQALDAREATAGLYAVAAGGLLIVLSLWWLYFAKPAARFLTSNRAAFPWGYGHYLIFGSAAAVGAGLAVNVDHATHHTEISRTAAGAAVTVPVAVFLLVLYLLHIRPHHALAAHALLMPGTAAVVLALTFTGIPVLGTGLAVAALAAVSVTLAQGVEAHQDR